MDICLLVLMFACMYVRMHVCRYNPKNLYQMLNDYWDNAQWKGDLDAVQNTATGPSHTSRDNISGLENGMECSLSLCDFCIISHVTSPRNFIIYDIVTLRKMFSYFNLMALYHSQVIFMLSTGIKLEEPHIRASFNIYFLFNRCVTNVKYSKFYGHYLRNRSNLNIGEFGYIGIF